MSHSLIGAVGATTWSISASWFFSVAPGVSTDGATDRGFRDPFDSFVFVNKGGDYILGRLDIHGTE